jgi:hypothetical protein
MNHDRVMQSCHFGGYNMFSVLATGMCELCLYANKQTFARTGCSILGGLISHALLTEKPIISVTQ